MSTGNRSKPGVTVANTHLLAGGGTQSGGSQVIVPYTVSWSFPTRPVRPNPLSDTVATLTRTYRNTNTYSTASRRGSVSFVFNSVPTTQVTISSRSEIGRRRIKAFSKLGGGDFNLAVAIAEVDKSAAMIYNRVRQIHLSLLALKKGDRRAAMVHLVGSSPKTPRLVLPGNRRAELQRGDIANSFLELQYGWRPLISDIYGGLEALQKGLSTRGAIVRGSSGSKDIRSAESYDRNHWYPKGTLDLASVLNAPLASRSSVTGRVSNPNLRTLSELGLTNPALVAWELVPFSFVVDWFIPIGDILRAWTSTLGLSGVRGSVVSETRTVVHRGGIVETTASKIDRDPIALPGIVFPFNASALSIERTANAIALMRQDGLKRTRFR